MAESYGLNFNLAMTTNENGVVDLGVHVTDSDGLDLDHKASGKDAMKVINNITGTLARELMAVSNGRKQKNVRHKKLRHKQATRIINIAHIVLQAIYILVTLGMVLHVTLSFLKKVAVTIVLPMGAIMAHINLIFLI